MDGGARNANDIANVMIYEARKLRILTFSSSSGLVSHSHTTNTRHPRSSSSTLFFSSRILFRSNFSLQYSVLVFGNFEITQPCWCQKQPCTKMIFLRLGKTRSGLPGRDFRCRRYRKPSAWISRRTISSGLVSLPLIRDITQLRCSGVRRSMTHPCS